MDIGIVAALPGEIRMLTTKPVAVGRVVELSDGIQLARSGVGTEAARRAGELLLLNGAEALLSWGCAAALDDTLACGHLILPERVLTMEGIALPVDRTWQRHLYRRLAARIEHATVHTAPLVESRTLVADPAGKRALCRRSGAVATDMESAALGRLAQEAQIPFMVIRAIADTADMSVPSAVLHGVDESGRVQPWPFLRELIAHPRGWITLMRLARGFRAARNRLERVARELGEDFVATGPVAPARKSPPVKPVSGVCHASHRTVVHR